MCCIKHSIIYDIILTIVGIHLSQSATSFSSRMYGFNPRAVNVGFVVDKVVQIQIFSKHFHVSLPIIIPPMFYTRVLHLHHQERLCYSSVSHSTMVAWVQSQVMWNLWLSKWPWCGFSNGTSVSSVNSHSISCFTFTNHPIMYVCMYV